jgi:MoaA/NifB/PqqE/SkfB family radical SAM enzyme
MVYSEKPKLHMRQKAYKEGDLRTVLFDITNKCNMHCPHCYFETFRHTKLIPLEQLEKPFQELYEMGVYHLILGGGEPIRDFERLEKIISMIHPDESYINVLSNGWFMTPENIQKLKELKVDKICFSLDSGIEQEHDQNRKAGSYQRVLQAVDDVVKAGLFASIDAVPTHESLYSEGFRKLLEIAKEKQIRLEINIARPVGKWDGREDVLLTPEDSAYLRKLSDNNPLASDGHPLIKRDLYRTNKEDQCRAGNETLYITVDGKLTPCVFLQFSLGNITERSIKKMRDDLIKSEWFNGKHTKCLCGEDREFFKKFIKPYVGVQKPLDAYEVFGLKKDKENN